MSGKYKLSTLENGVSNLSYFINLELNPARTGMVASFLIVLSHLNIQSVISFLDLDTAQDPFFFAYLKVIDGFKISTHFSFSSTGLLRGILWFYIIALNVSLLVGTLYLIMGSNPRTKRFLLLLMQSLQTMFEFVLLVPTFEYTFFKRIPTCEYSTSNIGSIDDDLIFQNNNQLPSGYGTLFIILVGITLLVSISLERVFLYSFKKVYQDRLLEQNKLVLYLQRIYALILVILSERIQQAGFNILLFYGIGIILASLLLICNLLGLTYCHTNSHLVNGYMMTWTLWHTVYFFIEYSLLKYGIQIGDKRSVIYLLTLCILLKFYGRIHQYIFNLEHEFPFLSSFFTRSKFLRRRASTIFIRRIIEDGAKIEKDSQRDFQMKCFMRRMISENRDKLLTQESYKNLLRFVKDEPGASEMQPMDLIEEFVLWTFENDLENELNPPMLKICEFLSYQAFYCRRPIMSMVSLGKLYFRSQSWLKKAFYRAFLRIIDEENVMYLKNTDYKYFKSNFFEGIIFDKLYSNLHGQFNDLKNKYQSFYSLLGNSTTVSQAEIFAEGASYVSLYRTVQKNLNQLLQLNPKSPNALQFKIEILKELEEASPQKIEKLMREWIQLKKRQGVLKNRDQGIDLGFDNEFEHMDDNNVYLIVNITNKVGEITWSSSNFSGILDQSKELKLTLDDVIPSFMVSRHKAILQNFLYNATCVIPDQVRYPLLFLTTSEGFAVPVNLNTKLQTIDSLLYGVAAIELIKTKKKYIFVSSDGSILGYSKELKETLFPESPKETLGLNICLAMPDMADYFLSNEGETDQNKFYPNGEASSNLTVAGFKVTNTIRSIIKDKRSGNPFKGSWEKGSSEFLHTSVAEMQARSNSDYEVTLTIIKKDYLKHGVFFKVLEISSIMQVLQTNTEELSEIPMEAIAYNNYQLGTVLEKDAGKEGLIKMAVSQNIIQTGRNIATSNRVLLTEKSHHFEHDRSTTVGSSSKTTDKSLLIKNSVRDQILSKKLIKKIFLSALIGILPLLIIISLEYYQGLKLLQQFYNSIEFSVAGSEQQLLWSRSLQDASKRFMNDTGEAPLNEFAITSANRVGSTSRLITDSVNQLQTIFDAISISSATEDYLRNETILMTFPDNGTILVQLTSFVQQSTNAIRELELWPNQTLFFYDSPQYIFLRNNSAVVETKFSEFQQIIDQAGSDWVSQSTKNLSAVFALGILFSVASAFLLLMEYGTMISVVRNTLKLFFYIPRPALLEESLRFNPLEIKKEKKAQLQSVLAHRHERIYARFRPSRVSIIFQIGLLVIFSGVLSVSVIVPLMQIRNSTENIQTAQLQRTILGNTQLTFNQLVSSTNQYFTCLIQANSNCSQEYLDATLKYENCNEAFNNFKNFVVTFETVSDRSMFNSGISSIMEAVNNSDFCEFVGDSNAQGYCNGAAASITTFGFLGTFEYVTSQINSAVENLNSSETPAAAFASYGSSSDFAQSQPLQSLVNSFMDLWSENTKSSFQRQIEGFESQLTISYVLLLIAVIVTICLAWYILATHARCKVQTTLEILHLLPSKLILGNAQIRKFFSKELKADLM